MSWEDVLKMPQGGSRRHWSYRYSRELERKIKEEFPGLVYVRSDKSPDRTPFFETHLRTEERIDEKDGLGFDFKHYVFTHKEPVGNRDTDVEGVMQRIREEIKKDPYDIYETESQEDKRLGL